MIGFKKIEILNLGKAGLTVTIDEDLADHLTIDEALGVVASALFRRIGDPAIFVKTPTERGAWERKAGKMTGAELLEDMVDEDKKS
ncbi:MAG: hypothetical protein ACXWPM_04395 [Bdellovibrionota bacterium]